MTDIDFIEALNLHATNGMSGFALFLTLTFSYMTAIYIVGGKISHLQITLLSLLYFIWAISFALVAITHLQSIESLVTEYPKYIRARMWFVPWSYLGWILTVGGIVICCYFVYDIRSKARMLRESGT